MVSNPVNTTTSAFGQPVLHPAWDKYARWALRSQPLFRQFVDITERNPTNRSNVYYLPIHKRLTVAADRHVVDEVVAPDTVAAAPTDYVRVSIAEHAHAVGRTTFLNDTSFIPVDPVIARQSVDHMADTLDAMAADTLYNGDQIRTDGHVPETDGYSVTDTLVPFTQVASANADGTINFGYDPDTERVTLGNDNTITSRQTARIVARLRDASATPWRGAMYVGIMSSDTAVDYQEDTGVLGWNQPHKRVDTGEIYVGEVGTYRGVIWIEHPRARKLPEEGAGTPAATVQQTLIFGREVLAQVVRREPGMGVSPVLDTYNRHRTIYWYGTLGFACYRQEPLWRLEHGSSEN
jgi:N4-gp56 family major capsid protein